MGGKHRFNAPAETFVFLFHPGKDLQAGFLLVPLVLQLLQTGIGLLISLYRSGQFFLCCLFFGQKLLFSGFPGMLAFFQPFYLRLEFFCVLFRRFQRAGHLLQLPVDAVCFVLGRG